MIYSSVHSACLCPMKVLLAEAFTDIFLSFFYTNMHRRIFSTLTDTYNCTISSEGNAEII